MKRAMKRKGRPQPRRDSVKIAQNLNQTLMEGIERHRGGDPDAAEAIYRRILSEFPRQPDALHFLGVLRHEQSRSDEAIDLIRSALDAAPQYVDAWNNLGNVYKETGRLQEAESAYQEAIAHQPAHAAAWNNLGVVRSARGAFDDAAAAYRRVIELAPGFANAYYNYARALQNLGDEDGAIAALRKALALDPGHHSARIRFAHRLNFMGRKAEAAAVFRDWIEAEPGNPIAAHMFAAAAGGAAPQRASDDFVRMTFDSFAATFDQVLLENLDYHAPDLVAAALAEITHQPQRTLDILDAGCGTGLCGPLLRPYARSLAGVDLSTEMLRKARYRGCYDRLHEAELTAFLESCRAKFDVAASADTLVYFGALDPVVRAARGALRPGGWLIFTVERGDDRAGFRIQLHGRYSHGDGYIRQTLEAAGFGDVALTAGVLRKEAGEPVHGWVVRARNVASRSVP